MSCYDAELRRHNEVLHRALGVRPHDHVLDIGCGTGQTTRQAARTAQAGSALGVDISTSAIERARELARSEGLRNVTFEHANARVWLDSRAWIVTAHRRPSAATSTWR